MRLIPSLYKQVLLMCLTVNNTVLNYHALNIKTSVYSNLDGQIFMFQNVFNKINSTIIGCNFSYVWDKTMCSHLSTENSTTFL